MKTIYTEQDLIDNINEYGILPFWSESGEFASSAMSGVHFTALWNIRERVVNSKAVVYGRFVNKKATFVSLDVFPYLAALRRDGYDFDSLTDEGRAPKREIDIMAAVGTSPTPSYKLSQSLKMKGFDGTVASLQNKTYLCLTFAKSYMGTALLCRPEDVFGEQYTRSQYSLTPEQNAEQIMKRAKGIFKLDEKTRTKLLTVAV